MRRFGHTVRKHVKVIANIESRAAYGEAGFRIKSVA